MVVWEIFFNSWKLRNNWTFLHPNHEHISTAGACFSVGLVTSEELCWWQHAWTANWGLCFHIISQITVKMVILWEFAQLEWRKRHLTGILIRLDYLIVQSIWLLWNCLVAKQWLMAERLPASLKKNKKDSSFCNQSDFKSEAAFFFLLGKINVVLWPNLKLWENQTR